MKKLKLNGFQLKQRKKQLHQNSLNENKMKSRMKPLDIIDTIVGIENNKVDVINKIEQLKTDGVKDLVGIQILLHFDKGYLGQKKYTLQELSWVTTHSEIKKIKSQFRNKLDRSDFLGMIDSWIRQYNIETSTEEEVKILTTCILGYLNYLKIYNQFNQSTDCGINLNFYFGKKEGVFSRNQMSSKSVDLWVNTSHELKKHLINSLKIKKDSGLTNPKIFKELYEVMGVKR